jgi:hypothetical protein
MVRQATLNKYLYVLESISEKDIIHSSELNGIISSAIVDNNVRSLIIKLGFIKRLPDSGTRNASLNYKVLLRKPQPIHARTIADELVKIRQYHKDKFKKKGLIKPETSKVILSAKSKIGKEKKSGDYRISLFWGLIKIK